MLKSIAKATIGSCTTFENSSETLVCHPDLSFSKPCIRIFHQEIMIVAEKPHRKYLPKQSLTCGLSFRLEV